MSKRTDAQKAAHLDALLARAIPRGSAGIAIWHEPDLGSDPEKPVAQNTVRWRGLGGPLNGGLAAAALLREIADMIEKGTLQ